jgi:Tol biopolymer transport system component
MRKNILSVSFPVLLITVFFLYSCKQDRSEVPNDVDVKEIWSWNGPDFLTGDISPDGRYLTDINWSSGKIDMVDLEEKTSRPMMTLGYEADGFSWMSSYSTDGSQIAYAWYSNEKGTHALRLYDLTKDHDTELIPAEKGLYFIEPLDWSTDDQRILVALQTMEGIWQLGWVDVENGEVTVLKELDWLTPGGHNPHSYPHAGWSPDMNYVGFDYNFDLDHGHWDLHLLSTKSGEINTPWRSEGNDRFLCWSEDGNEVYFYSDFSGVPAVYALEVINGEAVSEPKMLIDSLPGMHFVGISERGLAFGLRGGNFNTYLATVDFETGVVLEEPVQVDVGYDHRNNVGDWSDDGSELLYITFGDPPASREYISRVNSDLSSSKSSELPSDFHNKTGTVVWVSEAELLLDGNSPGYSGIHRFNMETQTMTAVQDLGEVGFFQRFKSNADGSMIYVEFGGESPGVVEMNLTTGEHRRVLNSRIQPATLAISPDSKTMAYLRNTSNGQLLEVADIKSGKIREIPVTWAGRLRAPVSWTPDGKKLIVGTNDREGIGGLLAVPVDGSVEEERFVQLPLLNGPVLKIHPNGKRIAFQGGVGTGSLNFISLRE